MIKSYSHGLQLVLSPDFDFADVVRDVCYKFASSRDFFGKADLVLAIDGRDLTDDEVRAVIQAIEYNSDIRISLIAEGDSLRDSRMVGQMEKFYFDDKRKNAMVIERSLESGEKITTARSVFVLGDVPEDAIVTSSGNIFIWGTLSGTAICGADNDPNAYIIAGDQDTCVVGIAGHSTQLEAPKKTVFFRKNAANTVMIRYVGHEIVAQPFSSMEEIRG